MEAAVEVEMSEPEQKSNANLKETDLSDETTDLELDQKEVVPNPDPGPGVVLTDQSEKEPFEKPGLLADQPENDTLPKFEQDLMADRPEEEILPKSDVLSKSEDQLPKSKSGHLSIHSEEELLPEEAPEESFTLIDEVNSSIVHTCKTCEEVSPSQEGIKDAIITKLGSPSASSPKSSMGSSSLETPEPATPPTPTTDGTPKNPNQPFFKIRYAPDHTLSFSLLTPITPHGLKNIIVQHNSLKFLCFHAGVIPGKTRFVFHDRISLPSLKKITFQIQPEEDLALIALPQEFIRLFHFLKEITFGQLISLRICCGSLTALQLPLASAFLPSYEPEDSHPLSELILKNRETLQNIVIGKNMKELVIKMYSAPCEICPGTCEPKNYPKIQNFESFPDAPLMPSLSCMLQKQKHLHKLSVTVGHDEVWRDIVAALRCSRHSLKSFAFNLFPIDGVGLIVDLKALHGCHKLTEVSMQFTGCNVIGWGFLPKTLTTLHFLGGTLTHSNTEMMALALPVLEEINVFLRAPPPSPDEDDNIDGDKVEGNVDRIDDNVAAGQTPIITDIVHHPIFHFVKAAPKTLKFFNVECDLGVEINWEELRSTLTYQKEFKLIERKEIGDFSLEREPSPETEQEAAAAEQKNSDDSKKMETISESYTKKF